MLIEKPIMAINDHQFIRRVLIVFALAGLVWLLWRLTDVWLLVFGSILVAVILRSIARPIEQNIPLSSRWSLLAAVIIIILVITLAVWLAGNAINDQFDELSQKIPAAWNEVKAYIEVSPIGKHFTKWTENIPGGSGLLSGISYVATGFIGSIADLLLTLVGGIYLAAQPKFYLRGILKLFPDKVREKISHTFGACGKALQLWLKGQLVSMIVIGTLITIGLYLVGLPSALALGLLAGLGEFVPIVGSLFAIIPALILGFAQGPETALWTLLVYLVVQQTQGNLITPLIQQHMVSLPPALTLFSLMIFTLLFGPLGLLFAAPMTVVAYVAVKKLYVREALGGTTKVPGEDE